MNVIPENREIFLALVRLGIGHEAGHLTQSVDWAGIDALAVKQGLLAVVVDGVEALGGIRASLPEIDEMIVAQWGVDLLQCYESRYEQYKKAISTLASFYDSHGFKMMVLKGYSCSLDWPRPNHRPCGDIDIWLFGKQKEADAALKKYTAPDGQPIKVDTSHHHHTVFYWKDFMVENHYDFLNVHHHKSNPEFERILKDLGRDDSFHTDLDGQTLYLPSPNLHALFLLRHEMAHFAATDITLRHLLDWAFFVQKHGSEVDWSWLESMLGRFGMKQMYLIFNAICVEDLGFEPGLFNCEGVDSAIKERVLNEIISPEFGGETPKRLLPRVLFKYRRWKANGWKHKLCYRDSLWSSFWSGVVGHLLKPSSI